MKKKAAPPPPPKPPLLRRLLPGALAAAAVLGCGAGFLRVQQHLKATILDRHAARLLPIESFQRPDPPAWLRSDRLGEELDLAVPRVTIEGRSFLDLSEPDLVRRIGRAAEKTGWLVEPKVRRGLRSLELTGEWRRPTLWVGQDRNTIDPRGFFLDGFGVVLNPEEVQATFLRRQVLSLDGLEASFIPRVGATVGQTGETSGGLAGLQPDRAETDLILAAADLARLVEPVRVALGIEAIQIQFPAPASGSRGRIDRSAARFRLVAPARASILWGPHEPGSTDAGAKLARLTTVAEAARRGEAGPALVDLTAP